MSLCVGVTETDGHLGGMQNAKSQRSTKKDMRYDIGQVKRSFQKHHEQPSAIEWIQQVNVLRLQFCSIMIMCVLGGGWMGLYVGVGWLPIAKCNHSSVLACLQLHVIPNHRHVFSIKWQFILRNISWQADFIFTYLMPNVKRQTSSLTQNHQPLVQSSIIAFQFHVPLQLRHLVCAKGQTFGLL